MQKTSGKYGKYGKSESVFSSLSESAKAKLSVEIKKAVSKQVKKELAKRRRKFARKLIVTGLVFVGGCVLYFGSDKIVDFLTDRAISASGKKKSAVSRKRAALTQRSRHKTAK